LDGCPQRFVLQPGVHAAPALLNASDQCRAVYATQLHGLFQGEKNYHVQPAPALIRKFAKPPMQSIRDFFQDDIQCGTISVQCK
jgi:hypothetical protein